MREWLVGVAVCLMASAAVAQANPQQVHVNVSAGPQRGQWINAAPVSTRLVVGSDGETYVGVWIDTPQAEVVTHRAPVDLSLVIDNSGSMAGDKIVNARMAAQSLLESLADGDIVSVYTFSNSAEQIAPPTVLNAQSRPMLMQAVNYIQPTGGTNLYAGLSAGEAATAQAPASHPVRRVVVISDGQANIGPSSPDEIGVLAAQGTESGAQVSAIGVGMDYDEHMLGTLAMRSAGRFYHLADPSEMAGILREEFRHLASTVATDAYIELDPAPGVQILGSEMVPSQQTNDGRLHVQLGSLYGAQHREILIRAHVDTNALGDRALANARLVYKDPSGARAEHTQSVTVHYAITRDPMEAQRSADGRVRAMVASYHAAQTQLAAAQSLNQGNAAQAQAQLDRAERDLRTAAAAAPPSPARARLEEQAERVHTRRTAVGSAGGSARPAALEVNADAMSAMGF